MRRNWNFGYYFAVLRWDFLFHTSWTLEKADNDPSGNVISDDEMFRSEKMIDLQNKNEKATKAKRKSGEKSSLVLCDDLPRNVHLDKISTNAEIFDRSMVI